MPEPDTVLRLPIGVDSLAPRSLHAEDEREPRGPCFRQMPAEDRLETDLRPPPRRVTLKEGTTSMSLADATLGDRLMNKSDLCAHVAAQVDVSRA